MLKFSSKTRLKNSLKVVVVFIGDVVVLFKTSLCQQYVHVLVEVEYNLKDHVDYDVEILLTK